MAAKKQLIIYLTITLLALTVVLTELPQPVAAKDVKITFQATGYSKYSGVLFTIDGTDYYGKQNFQWEPGSTHTVTAVSPITSWDSNVYSFVSWTNGDGLTTIREHIPYQAPPLP
jgi:hypothetical protein